MRLFLKSILLIFVFIYSFSGNVFAGKYDSTYKDLKNHATETVNNAKTSNVPHYTEERPNYNQSNLNEDARNEALIDDKATIVNEVAKKKFSISADEQWLAPMADVLKRKGDELSVITSTNEDCKDLQGEQTCTETKHSTHESCTTERQVSMENFIDYKCIRNRNYKKKCTKHLSVSVIPGKKEELSIKHFGKIFSCYHSHAKYWARMSSDSVRQFYIEELVYVTFHSGDHGIFRVVGKRKRRWGGYVYLVLVPVNYRGSSINHIATVRKQTLQPTNLPPQINEYWEEVCE